MALIVGGPSGAMAAAVALYEVAEWPYIIVNVAGAYLIFDSGIVEGFNRKDWGNK